MTYFQRISLKYVLVTILFILITKNIYSQNDQEIVSYFVKDQLEINENQTAFNIFKIQNNTSTTASIQVNFTVPANWTLFSERTHYLTLSPGQEISLPLRVTPTVDAKGGVGYALNANVLTVDGKTFATKYCFLTVPSVTDIKADFDYLTYYLDHKFGRTNIDLSVYNYSNSFKLLGVNVQTDDQLHFIDTHTNIHDSEVLLESSQDSTLTLNLVYDDYIENLEYLNRPISATITAVDTSITKYAFIKYLNYKNKNYIDETEMPLVVEISALDILSDLISYRAIISGKLKFQHNRNINYLYRSIASPIKDMPNYKDDEYKVEYSSPKFRIATGNIYDPYGLGIFGLGVMFTQYIGKSYYNIYSSKDWYSNNYNLFGSFGTQINKFKMSASYGKMINDSTYKDIMNYYDFSLSFPFLKTHYLSSKVFYNQYSKNDYNEKNGYGFMLNYRGKIGKSIEINSFVRSATPYGITYYHGTTDILSNAIYKFDDKNRLTLSHNYYKLIPASIYNTLDDNFKLEYHIAKLIFEHRLSKSISISGGPNIDYGTSNYINSEFADKDLILQSIKAEFGYNYTPNITNLKNITLNVQFGTTTPKQYSDVVSPAYYGKQSLMKFSATAMGKNWGLFAMYYSGLYNMNTALSNFYIGAASKYLFMMPYYRVSTPNGKFSYELRFSYLNCIDLRSTRTAILQSAIADFGGGWSARIQNSTNMQSQSDANGAASRYTSNYMEITIKKVFNWNQPGQKYHNLRTVFYRDLDGNHIKDANEPGVENVVLNIQNNSAIDTSYHYEGEMFGNMDVASNWDGSTLYEDIPEAQYYLTFTPTGRDDGKFALPTKNLVVDLKKDTTIYIPFNERNKVFGTIKFNRDKRSAVEEVQLGNIRVTITDSHGNTFSSLTDPTGYYEIFAPVADYYTVQVVNIWQEFFTIRQDRYIIKFNGYKTFEVNFEFDEKKREIFYNDDIDLDDIANNINLGVEGDDNFTYEDVTQIKQTILRGSVSDEKTYEPIPAIIEIMDISRHDVIAKVKCSETTGSFYTTFLTGNNYQMRVTAKGYWNYQELLSDAQITTFETINRDGLLLKKIEKGVPIELHNQYFNSNSSELTPEAKAELEDVVILLTNNEKVNVDIIGYTDNKENNTNELSRRRAKVVFDFIAQRGINASRLTYEGRGEIRPTERTDDARRECRRVDIVVK